MKYIVWFCYMSLTVSDDAIFCSFAIVLIETSLCWSVFFPCFFPSHVLVSSCEILDFYYFFSRYIFLQRFRSGIFSQSICQVNMCLFHKFFFFNLIFILCCNHQNLQWMIPLPHISNKYSTEVDIFYWCSEIAGYCICFKYFNNSVYSLYKF